MRLVLRLALLALGTSLLAASRASELNVSAAASLSDALTEIGQRFEKDTAVVVHFNFGASSALARQIREGAPADVFFSADEAKMDDLAKAGRVVVASRRSVLGNTLVVIVPGDSPATASAPDFLASPKIRRLALAEPATVPAGIYAREWLRKIGLWERVAGRVVPTENVRACLAAVESGNAEAGIVYRTDALLSKKVRIALEVPSADGPRISYPIAILAAAKNSTDAARFVAAVSSPEGLAIFRKYGFTPLP